MRTEETYLIRLEYNDGTVRVYGGYALRKPLDEARSYLWPNDGALNTSIKSLTIEVFQLYMGYCSWHMSDSCPCASYTRSKVLASWSWKKEESAPPYCEPNCEYCRFMRGL